MLLSQLSNPGKSTGLSVTRQSVQRCVCMQTFVQPKQNRMFFDCHHMLLTFVVYKGHCGTFYVEVKLHKSPKFPHQTKTFFYYMDFKF